MSRELEFKQRQEKIKEQKAQQLRLKFQKEEEARLQKINAKIEQAIGAFALNHKSTLQ